ncbi:MAG: hypothetical protein ACYSUI_07005 [Planctomycetota bacterium]
MCTTKRFAFISLVALVAQSQASGQLLLGTAFTYQGRLTLGGVPVTGPCDFEFGLWDDPAVGTQIGTTQTENNVMVINGLFSVTIDFGSGAIDGDARWLDIAVRCPAGGGAFTPLSPRQELTPSPHALALPGLYTQQNATSPNLIGGYNANSVTAGVWGATIAGGGVFAQANRVTDHVGTIGGGIGNQAGNDDGDVGNAVVATVGGGAYHEASGQQSTIGGGWSNEASTDITTVGGGGGNVASARAATVGGGWLNEVAAEYGTIAGGGASDPPDPATRNRVFDEYGAIGGGGNNQAGTDDGDTTSAIYSTVGGGRSNTTSGRLSTIGGGDENAASGEKSTIGGGASNIASLDGATVGGGLGNTAGNYNATVAGGNSNQATGDGATVGGGAGNIAGGFRSTVSGGLSNSAGGDYSFAAGRRAKADHAGTFVWGDSTDADFDIAVLDLYSFRESSGGGSIQGYAARGTEGSPSTLQAEDLTLWLRGYGYDGSEYHRVADLRFAAQSVDPGQVPGSIAFRTNDGSGALGLVERMTIDGDGDVGIGTPSPGARLDVQGGDLKIGNNDLFVDESAGQVGIGSTGIGGYELQVGDADGDGHSQVFLGTGTSPGDQAIRFRDQFQYWEIRDNNDGADELQFLRSTTAVMTMLINGNVGIGEVSPSEKLHVAGNVQVDGAVTTSGRTRRVFINPEAVTYTDTLGSLHSSSSRNGYGTIRLTPWENGVDNDRYSYIAFSIILPPDLKGNSVTYGILLTAC